MRKARRASCRGWSWGLCAFLGLLVAACAAPGNRGVDTVHAPQVKNALLFYDIPVSKDGAFTSHALANLQSFLDIIDVGRDGATRVSVDDRLDGGVNDGADARNIAAKKARARALKTLLQPLRVSYVPRPASLAPPPAPRHVRLWVQRVWASGPDCLPARPSDAEVYSAKVAPNYGCALRATGAAMIDDPTDLIQPERYSGTDAARIVRAVKGLESGQSGQAASGTGDGAATSSTSTSAPQ